MKTRELLYARGWLKRWTLQIPAISIGNLTLGGTGKTPTVRYVAQYLQNQGYTPAIVSRGYGGKTTGPAIVSDGRQCLLTPFEAGDEPYMLATALPGVPVLIGKKRIAPCLQAISDFPIDIIILDDGFQHLSIHRDLDVVLFDANTLLGNGRVFPGGILREPLGALQRAHVILLTGVTQDHLDRVHQWQTFLSRSGVDKPVFYSETKAHMLIDSGSDGRTDITKDGFGFCGIANPLRFKKTLEDLHWSLCGFHPFPDHYRYNAATIAQLCEKASKAGAKALVTTEKDYVKIKDFTFSLPLRVVAIRHQPSPEFDLFLTRHLAQLATPRNSKIL